MERATQMCDDYILLGNTKPKKEWQQIEQIFLQLQQKKSLEFRFFPKSLILWVPQTSGTCFSLAIHNINTKISGLPGVLQNILFVKYFKIFQMRGNLCCCLLLIINQQELFYVSLPHCMLTSWSLDRGTHERHKGLTHVHISQMA